jgi:hypothetical protein
MVAVATRRICHKTLKPALIASDLRLLPGQLGGYDQRAIAPGHHMHFIKVPPLLARGACAARVW